jgi:hypothetical protein
METTAKRKRGPGDAPQRAYVGAWAEKRTDLNVGPRLAMMTLLGRANRNGTFGRSGTKAIGKGWLGKLLGVPASTARDWLRELVDAGVLEKTGKVRVERGWANVYRITDPYLLDILAGRASLTGAVGRPGDALTGAVNRHITTVPEVQKTFATPVVGGERELQPSAVPNFAAKEEHPPTLERPSVGAGSVVGGDERERRRQNVGLVELDLELGDAQAAAQTLGRILRTRIAADDVVALLDTYRADGFDAARAAAQVESR